MRVRTLAEMLAACLEQPATVPTVKYTSIMQANARIVHAGRMVSPEFSLEFCFTTQHLLGGGGI